MVSERGLLHMGNAKERIESGKAVLGIEFGLLISFLFGGWFLRVLVAAALIVLGFLLTDCR